MTINIMQYLYSSVKSQNKDKKKKITWDHLMTAAPTAYIHFRADWTSELLYHRIEPALDSCFPPDCPFIEKLLKYLILSLNQNQISKH